MKFSNQFISATKEKCDYNHHVPAPYLRKTFNYQKKPDNAEITITGLGFYKLYFNGKNITKGHIAPYISNPDDILYYDNYNITGLMNEGENVIAIVLGNGMQNSFGGYIWDFDKAIYTSAPKTAFCFKAQCGDEVIEIEADESVKVCGSPITFDEFRSGEFYDANLEIVGWNDVSFDDKDWNNAILVEPVRGEKVLCEAEPVVQFEHRKAISITPNEDGYIYDFGFNDTGITMLTINATKAQEIVIEHAEQVYDNKLFNDNIKFTPDGYVQKLKYICSGNGTETYMPSFTYFGCRYAFVTGITPKQATTDLLTFIVVHSDIKEIGGFSCSDETLNKLQEMTRRSTLSNFHYFLTDCPQREKNGWTADAALSTEHALLNLKPEKSFSVWLGNVRKAMREDGALPGIVPTSGWGFKWGNGPAWDCVLVYIPYFIYQYRGDITVLKDNATSIMRYLNYITTQLDEKGLIAIGLGDWCNAGRNCDDYKVPLIVTDSIISMDIAKKAAAIFEVLGMKLQQQFAQSLADNLKASIRKYLLNTNEMTLLGNSQSGQAMGLFYNIFESGERQSAFNKLVSYIEKADNHIDVGVLGGRVIFHILSQFNRSDLAYKMITNDTFPSYAYWIKRGATTLWEDFIPDNLRINSLNHHFWGDISAWFIKCLAGININPNYNDYTEVNITPCFLKELDFCKAFHEHEKGLIEVNWERQNDHILLTICAPDEIHGQIIMENGVTFDNGCSVKPLLSGEYQIIVP